MGLFGRKKKKNTDTAPEFGWITVGEALSRRKVKQQLTREDVLEHFEEGCRQLIDVERQYQDTKREHMGTARCLQDMEQIERLSEKERNELNDTVRMLIRLDEERKRYQKEDSPLNEMQMHQMERYEEELPDILAKMQEREKYQQLVREDMKQLEGEKGVLTFEKDNAVRKKRFLRQLAGVGCAMVLCVFLLLFYLMEKTKAELMLPFFLTGILALGIVFYVIQGTRAADRAIRLSDAKMNRAIFLMNKVKIKYVNCTGTLDYMYEKYHVNGSHELAYLWEEYNKIKDEQKRYRKNTELLESYRELLQEQLRGCGVTETENWLYQYEALLDSYELGAMRRHIREREKSLSERLDYNQKNRDLVRNELLSVYRFAPEYQREMEAVLKQYGNEDLL